MAIGQEKRFLCYILLTDQISLDLPLLLEMLGNMCIVIIFYPVCDFINFKIYLSFLINPFSYMNKN